MKWGGGGGGDHKLTISKLFENRSDQIFESVDVV